MLTTLAISLYFGINLSIIIVTLVGELTSVEKILSTSLKVVKFLAECFWDKSKGFIFTLSWLWFPRQIQRRKSTYG
jgi:hypothetical protein